MKRTLPILLLMVLAPLAARAQGAEANQVFFDAIPFAGSTSDSTRIDLYIAIPYSAISFERRGATYVGRYQTRIRVEGGGRTWCDTTIVRTILAQKYENTTGEVPAYEIYQRRVSLPPGSYNASAEILDLRSNMATSAHRSVVAAAYGSAPLALSGLLMVKKIREDSGSYVITPMITESVGNDADGYFLFFEAYNTTGRDSFRIRASYRSDDKPFGQVQTFDRTIPAGRSQQWVRLGTEGTARGIFTVDLKVYAADDSAHVLASAQRTVRFEGTSTAIPLAEEELDEHISQLRYVAAQSDIDNIRGATSLADRQRRYADFWNKLDPTAGTAANEAMDEYFTRINYAIEHFHSYTAGWLTDKGRVYVIYGPPDNISTDPFRTDGRAVETWNYFHRGLKLSFVDESGFGDFRLTAPLPVGDKYRYGG